MKKEEQTNRVEQQAQRKLARYNHFIPQMYQAGWSDDGRRIWEYRTLVHDERYPAWSHRSISRTGAMENLYTRVSDGVEQDDFEHTFNDKYETPAVVPLNLAREGNRYLRMIGRLCFALYARSM